jgi:hypothetical protein
VRPALPDFGYPESCKMNVHNMSIEPSPTARQRAESEIAQLTESDHFHPLEAISFFRRWPRSFLRNFFYTLIFNVLFGLAFTLLAVMFGRVNSLSQLFSSLGNNLVISNVIGFAFWGVLHFIGPVMRRLNRMNALVIALFYTVLGTAIITLSFLGVSQLPAYAGMKVWVGTPQQLLTSFILSLLISLVLTVVWKRRVGELTAQIDLAQERERAEAAERAATQASLRALQAQIEPHFLFNTLANVVGLIHPQPDTAKLMLEQFIAYLRATLAATREDHTTLGREFDLMRTFLSVLQIRMGDRLKVRFDLPEDMKNIHLPPMLLQPLVENAIKHGLEPKIEGGELALSARRVENRVTLTVADTGLGFQNSSSNGIGLKNVRERVQQIFGDRGAVSIEENRPAGTRVVIAFDVA